MAGIHIRSRLSAPTRIVITGPQRPEVPSTGKPNGKLFILLIDASRSMLRKDYKPNRLEGAKSAVRAFAETKGVLGSRDEVALIAFAGKANVLCLPTSDYPQMARKLDCLTQTLPGKTALGVAILEAKKVAGSSLAADRAVILLSDGSGTNRPDPASVVRSDPLIPIHAIGIGSRSPGEKVYRLDEAKLAGVATLSGGTYHYAAEVDSLADLYRSLARI